MARNPMNPRRRLALMARARGEQPMNTMMIDARNPRRSRMLAEIPGGEWARELPESKVETTRGAAEDVFPGYSVDVNKRKEVMYGEGINPYTDTTTEFGDTLWPAYAAAYEFGEPTIGPDGELDFSSYQYMPPEPSLDTVYGEEFEKQPYMRRGRVPRKALKNLPMGESAQGYSEADRRGAYMTGHRIKGDDLDTILSYQNITDLKNLRGK